MPVIQIKLSKQTITSDAQGLFPAVNADGYGLRYHRADANILCNCCASKPHNIGSIISVSDCEDHWNEVCYFCGTWIKSKPRD